MRRRKAALSLPVRERKLDLYLQAAERCIGGANLPAMRIDRTLGDRKAEAEPGRAVAGFAAIERVEHFRELGGRDARSLLAHREHGGLLRRVHAYLYRRALAGELHRVSHHILARAL